LPAAADWDLESYAEARSCAEQAVRLAPDESRFFWSLAEVESAGCLHLFKDQGSRDRAYRAFDLAQALAPHDVRISLNAGEFALRAGDPLTARRKAEHVLRVEPAAVPAHLLLAESLLVLGPEFSARVADLLDAATEIAGQHPPNAISTRYERELLDIEAPRLDRIRERLTPPQ